MLPVYRHRIRFKNIDQAYGLIHFVKMIHRVVIANDLAEMG